MSDKSPKDPKDKIQVEPNPADKDFFDWWEGLFDGTGEFPEYVNVHAVSGPHYARLGPQIEQFIYKGMPKASKAGKAEGSREDDPTSSVIETGRPSREKIVATINRIRALCQRDCDQQRKSVVYGAHAMHYLRSDSIYSRFIFRCEPKGVHGAKRNPSEGEDDSDEELTPQMQWHKQKLGHDERMFNMYGAALEGTLDRMDKVLEREYMANDRLRLLSERQAEIIERLQSSQAERYRQAKWDDLKMKGVERGLNLAMDLGPPLLGQLMGKPVTGIVKTPESITLENFLKMDTHNGTLTHDQCVAAFGDYDFEGETRRLTKPGILTETQSQLLVEVAHCQVPPEALDRVLPGGDLEITQEQLRLLMQLFTPEQIMPLGALLSSRMARRQQSQQAPQPNQ